MKALIPSLNLFVGSHNWGWRLIVQASKLFAKSLFDNISPDLLPNLFLWRVTAIFFLIINYAFNFIS